MKKHLSWLGFLCLFLGKVFAQETNFSLWGSLKSGKYAIGFQTEWFVDEGRTYQKEDILKIGSTGRPFRLMIWYPAVANETKSPLTFGDYLSIEAPDPNFKNWAQRLQKKDKQTAKRQFQQEHLRDSLLSIIEKIPGQAKSNLEIAKGKFPLIIHLLGLNDYQQESTTLWEYLASKGNIVVVLPQIGEDLQNIRTSFSSVTVRRESKDIAAAINYLKTTTLGTKINFDRLGLLGHSLGGAVALHFASENPVKSVALLDGAIYDEESRVVLQELDLNFKKYQGDLLNLYPAYRQNMLEVPIFKSLHHINCYHISFAKATHYDFQQWPIYAKLTGVDDPRGISFRSTQIGYENYLMVCRLVDQFFEASLRENKEALDWVKGLKRFNKSETCGLNFNYKLIKK